MIRHLLFTLITLSFAFTSLEAAEPETQPAKTSFSVCGGRCSRSIRVISTHDSAFEALTTFQQIEESGEYRYLGVASGEGVKPYVFLPSFADSMKPDTYSVYRVGCKSCDLRGKRASQKEAADLVKKAEADGELAVIVYDFAKKPAKE